MTNNSLTCEYLGWGKLESFRAQSFAENEALIFASIAGTAPALIRGFLDCLRSPAIQTKTPPEFSENDLVEVMVAMIRTLPESLLQEWAQSNPDQTAACAILRW